MARIAYVNGRYVNQLEASVHIEDRGYQFADGVYEYIAFYNRKLLDGDLHLTRLIRSLGELTMESPVSKRGLMVIIDELIDRNGREDGGLYIQITRGVARRDHPFPKNVRPALVMTICTAKLPKPHEVQDGVKVITCPDQRWSRRDIKSISLLPNILAKQQAANQQAREAWLIEDGLTISEGAASNAYIVTREGELVTHHLDEHILGGVTRDVVLMLARKNDIRLSERSFNLVELKQAAEAFITSTSANVLPVVKIDDMVVGKGKPGPVTRRLQELYNQHIFKETGKQI